MRQKIFIHCCLFIVLIVIVGFLLFLKFRYIIYTEDVTTQRALAHIPADERLIIETYNRALLTKDWAVLYTLEPRTITRGIVKEQFMQLLTQQSNSKGIVTTITVNSVFPVEVNPNGLQYFTVLEHVTFSHNNVLNTLSIDTVFFKENGVWKFFTSEKH